MIFRAFLRWTSSCFHDNSSIWVSQIFSVCVLALCPTANAQDQTLSIDKYPCESVRSYYASVDHLTGEHLWPRSYGLTSRPALTNLHNIRPADVNVNSSRGNKYFGECQVGTTRCLKPANKEAAFDTKTDWKIWAPPEKREMGMLSILLKWNELDPPSREEKLRNEMVCRLYQHNRNPFVDHPEYAGLIWERPHASVLNTP